jgi:hypothetical protein
MPNVNSWNGRWSGEGRNYTICYTLCRKGAKELGKKILDVGSFYYNFGDGWGASISVTEIPTKDKAKYKRKSAGFCGYDWMVRSIIDNLEIKPPN